MCVCVFVLFEYSTNKMWQSEMNVLPSKTDLQNKPLIEQCPRGHVVTAATTILCSGIYLDVTAEKPTLELTRPYRNLGGKEKKTLGFVFSSV